LLPDHVMRVLSERAEEFYDRFDRWLEGCEASDGFTLHIHLSILGKSRKGGLLEGTDTLERPDSVNTR